MSRQAIGSSVVPVRRGLSWKNPKFSSWPQQPLSKNHLASCGLSQTAHKFRFTIRPLASVFPLLAFFPVIFTKQMR